MQAAALAVAMVTLLAGCSSPTCPAALEAFVADQQTCGDRQGKVGEETRIRACTRLIHNSKANTQDIADAYYQRGRIYVHQGRYDQGVEDLSQSLRLNPDVPFPYNNRAMAYRHLGNNELALADYNAAIARKPDYAIAYQNRGILYANEGKAGPAIADLDKGLALDPSAASHVTSCFGYGLLAMEAEALADCSKAQELGASETDLVFLYIGYAHYRSGHFAAAVESYTTGLGQAPKDPSLLFGRGAAYAALGQNDLARADIAAARDHNPDIDRVMAVDHVTLPPGL